MENSIFLGQTVSYSTNSITLIFGTITQITEKAIKFEYSISSVWDNGHPIYSKCAWIPKSQLIEEKTEKGTIIGLTVKKWFIPKISGINIKKYMYSGDQKVLV
jgi:hypothetical protein